MTNDEVIGFLYDIQTDVVYNVTSKEKEALEIAICAMFKQIAKKPESDYVEFFAEGNNVRRKWYYTCPACGNELKPDHIYCNCGQRILWEDENGNAAD